MGCVKFDYEKIEHSSTIEGCLLNINLSSIMFMRFVFKLPTFVMGIFGEIYIYAICDFVFMQNLF